jgi:hypothetical protein
MDECDRCKLHRLSMEAAGRGTILVGVEKDGGWEYRFDGEDKLAARFDDEVQLFCTCGRQL